VGLTGQQLIVQGIGAYENRRATGRWDARPSAQTLSALVRGLTLAVAEGQRAAIARKTTSCIAQDRVLEVDRRPESRATVRTR